MKHIYHGLLLAVIALLASLGCSKEQPWNDVVETDKTTLQVEVLNQKDATPIAGIRTILLRRVNQEGSFITVDTGRTDAQGKFAYAVSFPNDFKLTIDTQFYAATPIPVEFRSAEQQQIQLEATPKFGMAPLTLEVVDSLTGEGMPDFPLAISYREPGDLEFTSTGGTESTDAKGKLVVSLPWPSEVKVEVSEGNLYDHAPVLTTLSGDEGAEVQMKISTEVWVKLQVLDAIYKRRIGAVPLEVGIQKAGSDSFEPIEVEAVDEAGLLAIPATFPATVKIAFAGDARFGAKTVEVKLADAVDKPAELILPVKEARYTEPLITGIQVGTLALTDGITLNKPQDIVVDKVGNVYITEGSGHRILRVDRMGNTHVLAGTGSSGYEDGPGATARLNAPWGITIDEDGNLYFSDNSTSSSRIRKVEIAADYTAEVSTLAGTGSTGGSDGIGTQASFNRPSGICYDRRSHSLYVAEWSGHRVRKIDLATHRVSTVAGAGSSGIAEGFGTEAKFQFPFGVALSPDGKFLYVTSWNGNALHKIDLSNQYAEVLLRANNLGSPRGIYVSPAGRLFMAGTGGHQITYTEDPILQRPVPTLVGNGRGDTDGPASSAQFAGPIGIAYDPYTGTWYVADGDGNNQKVRTMKSDNLP